MLLEARAMAPDETASEEMKEVEMELEEKEHQQQQRVGNRRTSVNLYALESGRARARSVRNDRSSNNRLPSPETESSSSSSSRESSPSRGGPTVTKAMTGVTNLCSFLLSPAWVQTFVMTFLGEWGDRSQIATIAMAAGQDYWYITGGAIIGHGVCTAAAVLGGRAIAGKVSMRVGKSTIYFYFYFYSRRDVLIIPAQLLWAAQSLFWSLVYYTSSKLYINVLESLLHMYSISLSFSAYRARGLSGTASSLTSNNPKSRQKYPECRVCTRTRFRY